MPSDSDAAFGLPNQWDLKDAEKATGACHTRADKP